MLPTWDTFELLRLWEEELLGLFEEALLMDEAALQEEVDLALKFQTRFEDSITEDGVWDERHEASGEVLVGVVAGHVKNMLHVREATRELEDRMTEALAVRQVLRQAGGIDHAVPAVTIPFIDETSDKVPERAGAAASFERMAQVREAQPSTAPFPQRMALAREGLKEHFRSASNPGSPTGAADAGDESVPEDERADTNDLDRTTGAFVLDLPDRIASALEALPDLQPPSNAVELDALAREIASHPAFEEQEDMNAALREAQHLVLQRYRERPDFEAYQGRVLKLAMMEQLLALGPQYLGQRGSHLFRMLLELFEVFVEGPITAERFIREKSLTLFYERRWLETHGISELRELYEEQASTSMERVQSYVSELHGLVYLIDRASTLGPDTCVTIFNGTIDQFDSWLAGAHVQGNDGTPALRSSTFRQVNQGAPDLLPGLVHVTELAFGKSSRHTPMSWVKSLQRPDRFAGNTQGGFQLVLPPIVLGVHHGQSAGWEHDTDELQEAARAALTPISIVGPDLPLNHPDDAYQTRLPAGYPVCVSFLGGSNEGLLADKIETSSKGRLLVASHDRDELSHSVDRIVYGPFVKDLGDQDLRYCPIAADYYLFLVTLVMCASRSGGHSDPDWKIWRFLDVDPRQGPYADFNKTDCLDDLVFWRGEGGARRVGLQWSQRPEGRPDASPQVHIGRTPLSVQSRVFGTVPPDLVAWFVKGLTARFS